MESILWVRALGRLGRVFLEADFADMLDGPYSNPVRIFSFNPAEGWFQDIWDDIAGEFRRRCDLQGRDIPASVETLRSFATAGPGDSPSVAPVAS